MDQGLRGSVGKGKWQGQAEDFHPGAGFSHPCSDSSDSRGGGIGSRLPINRMRGDK